MSVWSNEQQTFTLWNHEVNIPTGTNTEQQTTNNKQQTFTLWNHEVNIPSGTNNEHRTQTHIYIVNYEQGRNNNL
jgi:uncharacterized protein YbdZ (MbtH family)